MILISACLAGVKCRYNGQAKTDVELRKLVREGKAVAVCPEVLGGLSVPRMPCEIRNDRVYRKDGKDVTDAYLKGSQKALAICRKNHCTKAVLKEKSPACGVHLIYDGLFQGNAIPGHGIFASMLLEEGIPCFSEYDDKEKIK